MISLKPSTVTQPVYFALSLLLSATLFGCGDDENTGPTKPPVIGDDAGTDAATPGPSASHTAVAPGATTAAPHNTANGDDAAAPSADPSSVPSYLTLDSGVAPDSAITPETDGASPDPTPTTPTEAGIEPVPDSAVPDSGTPIPTCEENADECVSCPITTEEYLNQCTNSDCSPFDNATRLGKYVAGEPLPDVP